MKNTYFYEHPLYQEDIANLASQEFPWHKLNEKCILISGASGMLGKFLIDVLMYRNIYFNQELRIIAIGRNTVRAHERFNVYMGSKHFTFIVQDINYDLSSFVRDKIDFIIHLASNTHPVAYSVDPIGTITTNIIGTKNLLELASENQVDRFVFTSSVEIYGENRGDVDKYDEEYCGYINSNTLRAGYPESKRTGETLCQAYKKQKGVDAVVVRLPRLYGPSMLMTDTKAISQFIKRGVNGEDIVLKSSGEQLFSYSYISDATSGLLTILFFGINGEAYNISDNASDIRLKDIAKYIADYVGRKVIYETPVQEESAGYSTATKAVLDNSKILKLGWTSRFSIRDGISRTIDILREVSGDLHNRQ